MRFGAGVGILVSDVFTQVKARVADCGSRQTLHFGASFFDRCPSSQANAHFLVINDAPRFAVRDAFRYASRNPWRSRNS